MAPATQDFPFYRCHIVVYLFENSSALRATLFSPDAEKLIHYMAADLKAADEKNVSLVREIDIAIRNKKVLCFIKCLDKTFQGNNVRTYPVLKMYLKSLLIRAEVENTALLSVSEVGTSGTVEGPEGDGTKELFTPKLKILLDEIEVVHAEATLSMQSNAVKRPLNFAQPGDHSCLAPSEKDNSKNKEVVGDANIVTEELSKTTAPTVHVSPPGNETGSTLQSPVKKTKKED